MFAKLKKFVLGTPRRQRPSLDERMAHRPYYVGVMERRPIEMHVPAYRSPGDVTAVKLPRHETLVLDPLKFGVEAVTLVLPKRPPRIRVTTGMLTGIQFAVPRTAIRQFA